MSKSKQKNMITLSSLTKAQTGIEGFDEITGGGLPSGRTTLVIGDAGAGKTVFALQTLVNAARNFKEASIFVAFEEGPNQILSNASTLGWNLALKKDFLTFFDARVSPDTVKAGRFDLLGLLAGIGAKAKETGAKRIVFDGIDIFLKLLDSPLLEREEIYRLHYWLQDQNLTGIITAKAETSKSILDERYAFMQFMVDCVVLLQHRMIDRVSIRELRVAKYRGSNFSENAFPMSIGPSGIEVAGIGAAEILNHQVSSERISTGLPRLDTMMSGGYFRGSGVLISGSPGTAKSTLATLFLKASCLRKERALYVSFEEAGNEIVRNMASIGIDLAPHVDTGLLRNHAISSEAKSAEEHFMTIKGLIRVHKPRCLVIDPISAMAKAGGISNALDVAQRLLRYAKSEGITTVYTSLLDSSDSLLEGSTMPVATLADTWIHLSYIARGGERNRALTIVKSRGTKHSNQVRELILSEGGATLSDVYVAGGDVVMGTARWEREIIEKIEKERKSVELEQKQRELVHAEADITARMAVLKLELESRQIELSTLTKEEELWKNFENKRKSDLNIMRGADVKTPAKQEIGRK